MKTALQACLLWLFVKELEECPLKLSADLLVDKDKKSCLINSTMYKNWIISKKYLTWYRSNSAAVGFMQGVIEFGQCKHIASAVSSKDL